MTYNGWNRTIKSSDQNARRKGNLQLLGGWELEAETFKQQERKGRKNKLKEYLRRTGKLHETKLYSKNLVTEINTRVVLLVRYLGPFLKWTREELKANGPENKKTNDYALAIASKKLR